MGSSLSRLYSLVSKETTTTTMTNDDRSNLVLLGAPKSYLSFRYEEATRKSGSSHAQHPPQLRTSLFVSNVVPIAPIAPIAPVTLRNFKLKKTSFFLFPCGTRDAPRSWLQASFPSRRDFFCLLPSPCSLLQTFASTLLLLAASAICLFSLLNLIVTRWPNLATSHTDTLTHWGEASLQAGNQAFDWHLAPPSTPST